MAYPRAKSYPKKYTKKELPKIARQYHNWSSLQLAIFEEIASGSGNLHVDALAGTGKTSTLVEGFYHVRSGLVLMVAFNKSIQIELQQRAPDSVTVLTLHALGLRAITKAFGRVTVDGKKAMGYIEAELGKEPETFELRSNIAKAVSLAKGYLCENSEDVLEVIAKHGVDTCDKSEEEFIALVLKVMETTKKDIKRIDFDDMIWFPITYDMAVMKYDYVFIDEAQDLNACQIELALRSKKDSGRVISVGDEHQAIYGFRGADSNAINNIVERMSSKRLPLSVTYRCAKSIVAEAQEFVEDYEAFHTNKEGVVREASRDQMIEQARPGDFILSRVNAPLIKLCLGFLKAGTRANIQGRDLGANLAWMIKKSKADDVDSFLVWLNNWRAMECMRLAKLNRNSEIIEDKAECLEALCEGAETLKEVKQNIDRLFHDGDDTNRIMLSSTHKAKGLERERVWVLRDTYRPSKGQEEENLLYVAITRSISELVYTSSK